MDPYSCSHPVCGGLPGVCSNGFHTVHTDCAPPEDLTVTIAVQNPSLPQGSLY